MKNQNISAVFTCLVTNNCFEFDATKYFLDILDNIGEIELGGIIGDLLVDENHSYSEESDQVALYLKDTNNKLEDAFSVLKKNGYQDINDDFFGVQIDINQIKAWLDHKGLYSTLFYLEANYNF